MELNGDDKVSHVLSAGDALDENIEIKIKDLVMVKTLQGSCLNTKISVIYHQSKRYWYYPVLVLQQGGGLCISHKAEPSCTTRTGQYLLD